MNKKDKLIEAAQKLIQKGQLDKAVKEYQAAVALEPGDQRVRQRLAELLVRLNRFDAARAEFEQIAKVLVASGFYLKAIAVYRQIEKLFPDDIALWTTLAQLYERHGLLAQALAEYKRAFDRYEQTGNHVEGLKVLEAMQKADPQNVNLRLKVAEVQHQLHRADEAFQSFSDLAGLLVERREEASFLKLAERMRQLYPQRARFALEVLGKQVESGHAEGAVQLLHHYLKADPHNRAVWNLLVSAYDRLGEHARLKATCQHFLRYFPYEPVAMDHLGRCLLREQAVDELLGLLAAWEKLLIPAGQAAVLVELYNGLIELAPIDLRIYEGALRACTAAGNSELAESFSSRIASLAVLQAKQGPQAAEVEGELRIVLPEEPADDVLCTQAVVEPMQQVEPEQYGEIEFSDVVQEEVDKADRELDSAYEIEIELDFDEPPAPVVHTSDVDWFETVSDIFGSVGIETGKVKIGAGLESGDSQTHYDLGMALREMGLLDEAINEFRQGATDPLRQIECLIQQGGCLREKGELQPAESAFRSLLSAPGLSAEQRCAISYELALVCEASGRTDEAAVLYAEIEAVQPAYRDVAARLQDATQKNEEGFDFDEDDLRDFELK